MREGPDLAGIAALVGDPARGAMLDALMDGGALTASELALEGGVTLPTASSHLARLLAGGLVAVAVQGRHRYYRLSGPQVAAMLESIAVVAEIAGPRRARPGPRDPAMREARICYDHLAGARGVALFDHLLRKGFLRQREAGLALSAEGRGWFEAFGIEVGALSRLRRPMCRACLDWSVRRSHLAGSLGAAMLERILARNWARRDPASRAVLFTPPGRRGFDRLIQA